MRHEKCCLSYWFPKLEAAGIPVPKTETLRVRPGDVDWLSLLEGPADPNLTVFFARLADAVSRIGRGGPVFLRTGMTSGKHCWDETCNVRSADPERLQRHVGALVEFSGMVDFFGLDTSVWVVRERLPVEPVATLPRYDNMPLVKEARVFVSGGHAVCSHPYWPAGAIRDGLFFRHEYDEAGEVRKAEMDAEAARLFALANPLNPADEAGWRPLANRVADLFRDDGAWSVDLLATAAGWFVTDMAEARRSYHYEGCPAAPQFAREGGAA